MPVFVRKMNRKCENSRDFRRMSSLPPIPIPARERWRTFGTEKLPLLLFGAGVVIAGVLWRHSGVAPTLLAEAESIQAEVKSLRPGVVARLHVAPLQMVAAGETIGFVDTADSETAAASFALIRAELDLLQASREPALQPTRVAIDRRRLELEWMRERVTLASLRGELRQAEADFARMTALHDKRLTSDEAHDTARTLHERLTAQLRAQEELVARLRPTSMGERDEDGSTRLPDDALAAGIRVQEQRLRVAETQFAPVPLVTPIAGTVLIIHRRNGEGVVAGEPIVTLAATQPTRLVGFLRQPLTAKLEAGAPVEIRTRAMPRMAAPATLLEVSGALESIPPTLLALLNRNGIPERGMRVQISVPPGLNLRAGEIVDVAISSQPHAP